MPEFLTVSVARADSSLLLVVDRQTPALEQRRCRQPLRGERDMA